MFTELPLLCNKHFIFFKQMLLLTFFFFFYPRKQQQNSPSLRCSIIRWLFVPHQLENDIKAKGYSGSSAFKHVQLWLFPNLDILPASHPVSQLFVLLHEQVAFLLEISQLHAKSLDVCRLWAGCTKVTFYETVQLVKVNMQCWVYRNLLIFIKDRWVELCKDAIRQQWLVSFWGHSCEEKWFCLLLMEMFARKQLLLNVLYVYWGIQGAENDSNTLKYNNLMPNLTQMLKPILQLNGWVSPQLDSWQFKHTKFSFKGECFISTGWSSIAQWGIHRTVHIRCCGD